MTAPGDERGSAMVVALLVAFILGLLGISFLMMSHTESQIADNEKLAAQALYAAEAGVQAVRAWFDRPDTAVGFPANPSVVIRNRSIVPQDPAFGTGPPEYKNLQDLNGDTLDDLFRSPYRGDPVDTLLGTPDGPDMSIVDATFLDALTETLLGDFPGLRLAPGGVTVGRQARITRIDVYAPPYIELGSTWTRFGLATVEVEAGIYESTTDGPVRVSQRVVRAVLNQTPYTTPVYGPVHVCGDLALDGPAPVHWGVVSAKGNVTILQSPDPWDGYPASDDPTLFMPRSIPRLVPPGSRLDFLWTEDQATVDAFEAAVSDPVDPWLRLISGGQLGGPSPSEDDPDLEQPWPHVDPPSLDSSNIVQNHPLVSCAEYDYDFWKELATSGRPGAHYYQWSGTGASFRQNGVGASRTFKQIFDDANGEEGIYFFDTKDDSRPRDDNGDGVFDNLTPAIDITGLWQARGFLYINAEEFRTNNLIETLSVTLQAPAEPRTPNPAVWVDLEYGATLADQVTVGDAGPSSWQTSGPPINDSVNLYGLLYNSGEIDLSLNGKFYGSLIAGSGARLDGLTAPPPEIYWDRTMTEDWPPAGWNMPRVFATSIVIEP